MGIGRKFQFTSILILIAAFLLPPQSFSQTSQTAPAQTKPTSAAKPSTAAKESAPIDWPREMQLADGKLMVYAPQIDEWPDYKTLKARSAVAFLKTGEKNPQLGIIELQAKTEVDMESRLVKLSKLAITGGNFPGLPKEQSDAAIEKLKSMVKPDAFRSISLDRILTNLERAGIKNVELKNDPPKIFYSTTPAVLVIFDGEPVLSPIKDNDLKYVVNTNWDVFYYEKEKVYFLRNDKTWLRAVDLKGPYMPADKLPDAFKKLPMDDNWKDVKLAIPPEKIKQDQVPTVFTINEPAEMILLKGEPSYKPIPGTNLVWVENTDSDLIFYPTDSYEFHDLDI